MNLHKSFARTLASSIAILAVSSACSQTPYRPQALVDAHARLSQLQADPELSTRAPDTIETARLAVAAAEAQRKDSPEARHLVVVAQTSVDIAVASARSRLAEDQRVALLKESDAARLEARTREADNAHREASSARNEAAFQRGQALDARIEAADAKSEAATAQAAASAAHAAADSARADANAANALSDELRQQIVELNGRQTERGLVVTLGDVMFTTGKSELRGATPSNLTKLSAFLNKYADRTVVVEGYTDSVGTDSANLALSQRRAEAVRSYLVAQGVSSSRIAATGLGESAPVADNASPTGRQQNRRVEVIIANPMVSAQR